MRKAGTDCEPHRLTYVLTIVILYSMSAALGNTNMNFYMAVSRDLTSSLDKKTLECLFLTVQGWAKVCFPGSVNIE